MIQSPDDFDDFIDGPPTVIRLPLPKRRPFQPWSYADIENAPDLGYLIGDEQRPVLLESALWQVFGKKKAAKTFYSLEMAFAIAFGLDFHGMPAKRGQVIYILAEGGIKRNFKRIRALYEKHQAAMSALGFDTLEKAMDSKQLILIDQTIKLAQSMPTDPTSPESFIKEIKSAGVTAPALIVLDTWARALWESGGNENSQEHVGPSVQSCEMIRKTFGGCALIMIAHVGAANNDRAKGLTGPVDAVDGATLCKKTGEGYAAVYTFKAVEQRHAEEGWKLTCSIRKPSETSASGVLVSEGIKGAINLANSAPSVRAWLDALVSLPGQSGSLLSWRKAGEAAGVVKGIDGEPPSVDTVQKSFKRARELLVARKAVVMNPDLTATATLDDTREPDEAGDFDDDEVGE